MDAVEYLKTRERMCEKYRNPYTNCYGCGMYNGAMSCRQREKHMPENCVAIVESWKRGNEGKTRKDELLKRYPKAELWEGIPIICPRVIEGGDCEDYCDDDMAIGHCKRCREKYWGAEV